MTAQQELDAFDKENPRLNSRRSALGEAYDQLCSHKAQCNVGGLPTSEAIDNAARAIKEAIAELQPLVQKRRALADDAYHEALGLKPREQAP